MPAVGLDQRVEWNHSILRPFALGDADPAGAEVDVVEADADELGDAHADVESSMGGEHCLRPLAGEVMIG